MPLPRPVLASNRRTISSECERRFLIRGKASNYYNSYPSLMLRWLRRHLSGLLALDGILVRCWLLDMVDRDRLDGALR